MYQDAGSVLLLFGTARCRPTGGSGARAEDVWGRTWGCGSSVPVPRGVSHGDLATPLVPVSARQPRDEFAVRPRTMPTNASIAGFVLSATQARATVEVGPSRSTR